MLTKIIVPLIRSLPSFSISFTTLFLSFFKIRPDIYFLFYGYNIVYIVETYSPDIYFRVNTHILLLWKGSHRFISFTACDYYLNLHSLILQFLCLYLSVILLKHKPLICTSSLLSLAPKALNITLQKLFIDILICFADIYHMLIKLYTNLE